MLWDLSTDYYLHHSDPRGWLERHRRSYTNWYTPEYLIPKTMPPQPIRDRDKLALGGVCDFDDYWTECYRPAALSSLLKVYSYRMTSTQRYLYDRPYGDFKYNLSPFVRRIDPHKHGVEPTEKKPQRKGVKIVDPQEEPSASPPQSLPSETTRPQTAEEKPSILRETVYDKRSKPQEPMSAIIPPVRPADKAQMHLWTLNQFHEQSLNPHVSDAEAKEYERYVAHPLNLPLVVSSELPSDANIDYVEYIQKAGGSAFDHDVDEAEKTFAAGINEADLQAYWDFVEEKVDPLTVEADDMGKKRYKAYRQWLRGKSLFKQSKVDPEYSIVGS